MRRLKLKPLKSKKEKMRTGKVLSLADFEKGLGIRIYDESTRKTYLWLVKLAKVSNVDVSSLFELQTFCKYLLVRLSRVDDLFEYMAEKDIELEDLEVNNQGVLVDMQTEEAN